MKYIDINKKFVHNNATNTYRGKYIPTNMKIHDMFAKELPKIEFQELLFLCCLYKLSYFV